jgi:hypothetical protein
MAVNENSLKNLIRYKKGDKTNKSENGRKGGLKSVEVRRIKKMIRDDIKNILDEKVVKVIDGVERELTYQEIMCRNIIIKASKGDIRCATFVRDSIGEKPVEKVEFVPTEDSLKEVEDFINGGK